MIVLQQCLKVWFAPVQRMRNLDPGQISVLGAGNTPGGAILDFLAHLLAPRSYDCTTGLRHGHLSSVPVFDL